MPARMARKWFFLFWESNMCNKLASLAQAREAHGAFGKALRERGPSKMLFSYLEMVVLNIGAPRPGTADSVLPLAEKGPCLHSGTGCAKAVFSEISVFRLGK